MKRAIVAIIGLTVLVTSPAFAYRDGDFQLWNTESQDFKINKELNGTFEEEFRWGENAGEFYYHHYDTGMVYGVNKYLDLGANYRLVYEKKKGKFKQENRPHINAILKYEVAGVKLEDRNRLEYRNFHYQKDFFRYRNKFTMKFPWKFTSLEIQPYVADEIFIPFNGTGLNENRLYSGFGFNITKNVKAEIYYMLRSTKSADEWTGTNVLGTKIKVSF